MLPSATSYPRPRDDIQANGGTIDLSKLTTFTGASGDNDMNVNAYNGGEVNLSGVTSQPSGRIQFYADGTGSTIDLSKLTALISDAYYNSSLQVQDGGTIIDPVLASLNRADLETDSTAGISTRQITPDVSSTITVDGGTPDFSGLTDHRRPEPLRQRRHAGPALGHQLHRLGDDHRGPTAARSTSPSSPRSPAPAAATT